MVREQRLPLFFIRFCQLVNPRRFYRRIEKNDKSKINEMVNT